MWAIECACVAILALYAFVHRADEGWLRDVALLAAAGWIGEETCILAYRFYQYAPAWHARAGEVPLLIAAIWPAIVMSARAIARSLLGARRIEPARVAALTGALVVFDAALIEPIAVRAGLWSWNEPGLFAVPPIGILGWGFFAAAATWWLERTRGMARIAVLLIAPIATHLALLATWWLSLRWMLRAFIAPAWGVAVIVAMAVLFATAVWRTRAVLAPRGELFARGVATLFFAALLARATDAWLLVYAAAFTPPHLLLCVPLARRTLGRTRQVVTGSR